MPTTPHTFDPDRLVAVAIFQDPVRAQLARSLLQSAGIECFLQGEHVNQMIAAAFRARLRVLAADESEARELLAEVDADSLLPPSSAAHPSLP